MSVLSRLRGWLARSTEGEYRPGPWPTTDGWILPSWPLNWWQAGHSPIGGSSCSAMVEACISAYAQTVAMCPGDHWSMRPDSGRDRIVTSSLTRILRRPNDYQTISDFLLNLTWSLYDEGNALALALRNDRFEVAELHLFNPRQSMARISETGEVFYDLAGNEVVERRYGPVQGVPARDVLHVRLRNKYSHPLKGVSPVMSAALDMAASDAAIRQQVAFFTNQNKASFILSTDEKLTPEQARAARAAWDEQTKGERAGGTPILSWGFKAHQIGNTAHDAQLAETLKMSDQRIALAYRVPMQVLGMGENAPLGSTEALMGSWLASGLGFALNHIEEAFGILFKLKGQPEEYLELNTRALLRSNFKDRVEGLARGVQGGIFAPDEARALEDLGAVPFGDQPRVQEQMVPLSFGAAKKPDQTPAPEPAPQPGGDAGERHSSDEIVERLYDFARVH